MTTKHERNAAKAKARSQRNTQRHENAQDRRRARRAEQRTTTVVETPRASYDDMNVKELKALCKKRSIPFSSRTRKGVLVRALEMKDEDDA